MPTITKHSVNDSLPESDDIDEPCNEYYLVWIKDHSPEFAMRMEDEWYTSYTSKLISEVTHWGKI